MAIKTQMIHFSEDGDIVPGYMAQPEGEGPFPAVVVLQEWWGMNDHIQDLARRFANVGYVALAPDLYRGQVANEPDEARKLAMALQRPQAVKDIQAAVDYLLAQTFVIPKKAGVVGFCMGGRLAGWMAIEGHGIGAVVVFYGSDGPLDDEAVAKISVPMLGLFGEKDGGIPVDVVRENEQKLKAQDKVCDFIIYPGAGHAFFNDQRASYHPEAAQDAWQRTLNWFHTYLVENE
ncbi:MAG: dienelactone hydrolase family protein [Anaerolineae bacterium]|nr:dienelactone hydrolase family protein [Anaerolineae bacterium]